MYEILTIPFNNIVSCAIFVCALAFLIIHSCVPLALWAWNILWGFLDDYEGTYTNRYLDLWKKKKVAEWHWKYTYSEYIEITPSFGGTLYVGRYGNLTSDFFNLKSFDSEKDAELYVKNELKFDPSEHERFHKTENWYERMYLIPVSLGILCVLVNFIPWVTLWVVSAASVVYLARSVRRLQKKAVSTLSKLKAHEQDKNAHT